MRRWLLRLSGHACAPCERTHVEPFAPGALGFGGISVLQNPALPTATMMVSPDVFKSLRGAA